MGGARRKTSPADRFGVKMDGMMRFLPRRLRLSPLGLLLFIAPLGCSTAGAGDKVPMPNTKIPETAMVAFDDTSTLTLPYGGTHGLSVTATPPMVYDVGFALLGDSFDGSLDRALVVTTSDGRGQVILRAPTYSTTFHVRASLLDSSGVPGASAERAVSVSEQGFASVLVSPMYLGNRTVATWSASVVANTTCADLKSQDALPSDPAGALTAMAPAGGKPLVDMAPVGPSLAVAVRAGHFAWGCADAALLVAGATLEVPVKVVDKPLDLQDGNLAATFTYTPDPSLYATVLGDAVSALVDTFMPLSSSEGTIVLNGMAAATTDSATFAALREQDNWDMAADAHFSALPKSLRATCTTWAAEGTAMQPTSFQANLVGAAGGQVVVTVMSFGNLLDAMTAGVTVAPGATWSGQPDDSMLLNATLLWEPSRFAGASSLGPAQAAHMGVQTVGAALALEADCPGLAAKLGAFGSCSLSCVEKLCETAIASRWGAALDASKKAAASGMVVVQASGACTVGDIAEPLTVNGHWQGQLSAPTSQLPVKTGSLTAVKVVPTP
jgi:hypothetical protein